MAARMTDAVARAATPVPRLEAGPPAMETRALNAYFGSTHAVRDVSLGFPENEVTAIIGPSGCGKSTLLRCLNRMHETVPLARVDGEVLFHGRNIYGAGVDPIATTSLRGCACSSVSGSTGARSTRSSSARCDRRRCGTR